jgi:magnesium chelatase subunit H
MRFAIVTLDHHVAPAFRKVSRELAGEVPELELSLHVAADWETDPAALEACREELRRAHVVLVTQLFMKDHIDAVHDVLAEERDRYDALVAVFCEGSVMRLTRMGRFDMGGENPKERSRFSPLGILKRLRGERGNGGSSGKRQMAMLRSVPKLLRFVPGTAQDVRAYLLTLRYWLAASDANLRSLVLHLVGRYGDAGRTPDGLPDADDPVEYLDSGLYHPDLPGTGITDDPEVLAARARPGAWSDDASGGRPRVGLLLMRSHVLGGNARAYDAVIRGLEERGLHVVPAFASGLDNREVVDRYFVGPDGASTVDAVVSLTGFSLVGGPAYSDTDAARNTLEGLDVPYLVLQPLEFQSVEEWSGDSRGLNPLQSALMVALPELDGATGPAVFGGRSRAGAGAVPVADRVERITERVARWVRLRRTPRNERRVAVVLFNFPPNAGAVGTAAYLDVFQSLQGVLERLHAEGYAVEVPDDVDDLRRRLLEGNSDRFGTDANVEARIPASDHVRDETWLAEIESVWGAAPGRNLTDGQSLFVQGARFGNVFVGIQPPFGWEGDPMRLLFEGSFAPTHAFSAFYRWIRQDFGAHAYLHFGTHGALEFMPGKQVGLGEGCWPDRLVGDVPNVYLYASNNPSEGTLAKRRAAATLVTYLTPSVSHAGLYRDLARLKADLDRWSGEEATGKDELEALHARAESLDLVEEGSAVPDAATASAWVAGLRERLLEMEYALMPHGLHVIGRSPGEEERVELLLAAADAVPPGRDVPSLAALLGEPRGVEHLAEELRVGAREALSLIARDDDVNGCRNRLADLGASPAGADALSTWLGAMDRGLRRNEEMDGVVRALDGRFVPPAPGGDLLRTPEVLPTGRNLYGFDPYALPTPAAMEEGRAQVERLLETHREREGRLPETVAVVLWGTDNLKRQGAPIGQALALMGAEPVFDSYGRLCSARLLPLEELDRPRIDVVVTTSGIFRDLLPLQTRLLAEAALAAASADEPPERNAIRRHALASARELDCSLEEAAVRVFSNDEGAYGANVNLQVDRGVWQDEDELADTWLRRKAWGYGADARAEARPELLGSLLAGVDLTYQNLESVELGVTDVDQYVDSLGGLSRAVTRQRGTAAPTYVGDETRGRGRVRALKDQVALEARTRILNPRWYETMLDHGYEGVRELEARATSTLGWSATTGEVDGWVYDRMGETFVLDDEMRRRLAELNPGSAVRLAGRLVEATERGYWTPDDETLERLEAARDELEDTLEGIESEVAA